MDKIINPKTKATFQELNSGGLSFDKTLKTAFPPFIASSFKTAIFSPISKGISSQIEFFLSIPRTVNIKIEMKE